jgi:hypothetical protein
MSDTSEITVKKKGHDVHVHRNRGGAGFVWFLGFIGAAVYYIQQADGFWAGVLGILKAFVWPAFLVYSLLHHVAG